ncbi:MAG: hypothetical protein ABI378_09685 [Chitinophagaceae bacterium]
MNHKALIAIGSVIWIVSFFGEIFACQPYSTIGIVISPILLVSGLFSWFKYYKSTRGHFPMFWGVWKEMLTKMKSNPFAGMGFMVNHILEFLTFSIIFWMLIILLGYLTFGQSDSFQATKKYCENNKEILVKTGIIRYYGVLVGGTISTHGQSGNANLSFTIIGSKGNFSANSALTKENHEWTVDYLTLQ